MPNAKATTSAGGGSNDANSTSEKPVRPVTTGDPGGRDFCSDRGDHRHAGEDMAAPCGTPIHATQDGTVVSASNDGGGYGNYTIIDHGNGIKTGYGHQSAILVHSGQKVTKGQVIGRVGDTGHSFGCHLHFNVWGGPGAKCASAGTTDPNAYLSGAVGPGSSDAAAGTGAGATADLAAIMSFAKASAFATELQFPTLLEGVTAVGLQGQKSLMNDKPLLPWVQQLCEASLRQFQSMPDGSFFAFYPDYFGETYHHQPYWLIEDIEVLDGGVELTDDSLATHMYVVGDTTWTGEEFTKMLFSQGVITIFNAFLTEDMFNLHSAESTKTGSNNASIDEARAKTNRGLSKDGKKQVGKGFDSPLENIQAINFLQRYGARPVVEDMPMIHSPFFEMFLAYQRFMLAWSTQFLTTFTFTFMPELYPGGKVAFPNHGLQMYIEEVTHSFSYESGFTTQANLMAPSIYDTGNSKGVSQLPPNMINALMPDSGIPGETTVVGADVGKASGKE